MAPADLMLGMAQPSATEMLSNAQLTGREQPPLIEVQTGQWLQPACAAAFNQMAAAAKLAGIDLAIASSWRSFERQSQIVAAKLAGQRTLYDLHGKALAVSSLTASALIDAVLLYSALPGASRHHWGTDLDVFDRKAVPVDYQLQLQASEYTQGGPFAALSAWLAEHAASFGFFRPYQQYRQGVAPEPWHLSYRPLATGYLQQLSAAMLNEALQQAQLPLQDLLTEKLPELFNRYVINIDEDV